MKFEKGSRLRIAVLALHLSEFSIKSCIYKSEPH